MSGLSIEAGSQRFLSAILLGGKNMKFYFNHVNCCHVSIINLYLRHFIYFIDFLASWNNSFPIYCLICVFFIGQEFCLGLCPGLIYSIMDNATIRVPVVQHG
jgi:hypothetical protein